jgi:hypothetical protein
MPRHAIMSLLLDHPHIKHVSLASTTVYLHARDEDKRQAVETVAAGRRYQ